MKNNILIKCPAHDDKTPSLSITNKNGKLLWHCFSGCSQEDVMQALKRQGFNADGSDLVKRVGQEDANKNALIQRIWSETHLATGMIVERYLNKRGIYHIPDGVRYHASLYHAPSLMEYPAMVCGITVNGSNTIKALHRTYLSGSDKAPIKPNKMMLGSVSGGAVMLAIPEDTLVLAEGIETAISVQQETGIPTWAVLSASNYSSLILPVHVQEIIIAADHDPAGLRAAYNAAEQWTSIGKKVRVSFPKEPGKDFNDCLKGIEPCKI